MERGCSRPNVWCGQASHQGVVIRVTHLHNTKPCVSLAYLVLKSMLFRGISLKKLTMNTHTFLVSIAPSGCYAELHAACKQNPLRFKLSTCVPPPSLVARMLQAWRRLSSNKIISLTQSRPGSAHRELLVVALKTQNDTTSTDCSSERCSILCKV